MLCLDVDIQGHGIAFAQYQISPDFDITLKSNYVVWMCRELTLGIHMRGSILNLVWMVILYIRIAHL